MEQVRKLMDYKPFHICSDCRSQFEDKPDFNKHKCIIGKTWAAFA